MTDTNFMPSFDVLSRLPIQHMGHDADLRVERSFAPTFSTVRLWTSRCSKADGEPFDRTVHVEVREHVPGTLGFYLLGSYDGDNPPATVDGFTPEQLGFTPEQLGVWAQWPQSVG